jgi:broad specificity phosphatase PhoE
MKPQDPKIFLVRHGQSQWNREKRITGQCNPPLSEKGERQARLLAQVLREQPLTAIYTSALQRAQQTARPTACTHGLPLHVREALNEIHLGVLQGRFRDERDPEAQRLWRQRGEDKLAFRPPGGETYDELRDRVLPCLQAIIEEAQTGAVLIVGHRNTNRVLLGALLHWPIEVAAATNINSKYLYEVSYTPQPQVRTICLEAPRIGRGQEGFHV